jgi:hypothetical protein
MKIVKIPLPAQWTVLLAKRLTDESDRRDLPYGWSHAESGGMALQWARPQVMVTRNKPACFTMLIWNDGTIVFVRERNGFGNTVSFNWSEQDLDVFVNEIINEIERHL